MMKMPINISTLPFIFTLKTVCVTVLDIHLKAQSFLTRHTTNVTMLDYLNFFYYNFFYPFK